MGSKSLNLEEKEDRISSLPDSIIQHILSFLPSTKESVRTGILSKRWQTQWTHVPVLIFDCRGMSYERFLKFIEYTLILHDCSKIQKFHLEYGYYLEMDPQFATKIRFATRKHVEELKLGLWKQEVLPTFLFNHASLVKLDTIGCTFMPIGKVNWGCLTTLNMLQCKLSHRAMEHILSGSPSLESLELEGTHFEFGEVVIVSKSLKNLVLSILESGTLEISCPNLEKLSLRILTIPVVGPNLFAGAIKNVLSCSLLLESFELVGCRPHGIHTSLVIASTSLKRLVLKVLSARALEISCPKLEELKLENSLMFKTIILNLPSSLCATIDITPTTEFDFNYIGPKLEFLRMIQDILQSLQHVKQLEIGTTFIKILSELEGGWFLPTLNFKCLILNCIDLNQYPCEISHLLLNLHVLEELVIKGPHCHKNRPHYHEGYDYDEKLNDLGENYWSSNKSTDFKCLESHLKTIKIIGYPYRDHNRKLMRNFIQFLLKNAKVLKKMIVELKGETTVVLKVSQEILRLPKYSRHAIVELLCSSE